jgi:transposase
MSQIHENQTRKALAFLSPAQIAERYGVGVGRVIGWIRSGRLKGVIVSSSLRSRKPQFRVREDWLETFEQASAAKQPGSPRQRVCDRGPIPQLV